MSRLLGLRNLRKSMGGRLLLDIDRFDIDAGACLVLTGRNGTGKSTLLKIIAGLLPPDHLEISYRGQTLPWRQMRRRLHQDVVYLHQQPYMFDRSVEDNVAYGLERAGLDRKAIRTRVTAALEWADLTHLSGKNARRLSGGEKQRVALTRARVLSPKLLLLDEPFASMDIESREQGLSFIRRLRDEGIATMVTSHEPAVAQVLGDQHLHLCQTGPCRYSMVRSSLHEQDRMPPDSREPKGVSSIPAPANGLVFGSPKAASANSTDKRNLPRQGIAGVILAGGMGRRMGGQDKGLVAINGRPLIAHVIDALLPQVGSLIISANRNLDSYRAFGHPVVQDMVGEFYGPLVGIASAMQTADTPYLLAVPCDSPRLPADLLARLFLAVKAADADISVVHDGSRMQPVFALLRQELLSDMLNYLENGGRRIDTWYATHRLALADFSDQPNAFLNINTPAELAALDSAKSKT